VEFLTLREPGRSYNVVTEGRSRFTNYSSVLGWPAPENRAQRQIFDRHDR
jgi:hypothetical protein